MSEFTSTAISIQDLESNEFQPYFKNYIDLAGEGDVRDLLEQQVNAVAHVLDSATEEQSQRVDAPYTWTIKQVVGHLIDGEKIFGIRAHRIACFDSEALPGFDHNDFVAKTSYEEVALKDLAKEWTLAREVNRLMLRRISSDAWKAIGTCDGQPLSVRAIAFILVGHVNHHLRIIEERLAR